MDELNESIRRLALDINARMITLQTVVESGEAQESIQNLINLRNCVQSAASVVSSASTTLGIDQADHFSVTDGSEFDDCFPSKPSETMLRWISSNTVYESERNFPQAPATHNQREASGKSPQRAAEISGTDQMDHSDSDTDIDAELVQALLKQGKERLYAKDFGGAERLLHNCLSRPASSFSLKVEVMTLLVETYLQQEKWTEAQSILVQKIASVPSNTVDDGSDVLLDILTLADVLLKKGAYKEALLYGRRALKGYRKMGELGTAGVKKALQLLVTICNSAGDVKEQEAYMALLSDFMQQVPVTSDLASEASGENGRSALGDPSQDLDSEKVRSVFPQSASYPVLGSSGADLGLLPRKIPWQTDKARPEHGPWHSFDTTGQHAPLGMKPRITATLWEEEGTLCFVVDAKGDRVARREGMNCL